MFALSYHPAFDTYHGALRILELVNYDPARVYEREYIRILDFYLVFPQQIANIRLPRNYGRQQKAASGKPNRYKFSGSPALIFNKMAPLQDAAMRLLLARGLIVASSSTHDVFAAAPQLPPVLRELVAARTESTTKILSFLISVLGSFPLRGKDGLKDRTGLLGYKYDTV